MILISPAGVGLKAACGWSWPCLMITGGVRTARVPAGSGGGGVDLVRVDGREAEGSLEVETDRCNCLRVEPRAFLLASRCS